MRRSIRNWLVLCLVSVLVVTVLGTAVWTYFDSRSALLEEKKQLVLQCAALTSQLLDQTGFDLLQGTYDRDSVTYQEARTYLRRLCQVFELDYLYVFSLDVESELRIYRYCVAADDDMDELIQQERPPGSMFYLPVFEEERQALDGEHEITYYNLATQFGKELTMLVPYRNRIGNICALIGADVEFDMTQQQIAARTHRNVFPLVLGMLLALVLLLFLMRKRIIRPVRLISDRMKTFISDRNKPLEPLRIRSRDEIGEIASSFEKMRGDIDDYLSRIGDLTRRQMETDVQMNVARRIQLGLVPERTALSGGNWDACAISRPTREVGGDFYDCFSGANGVCLFVGDVSGKGISAALFMASVKTLLHEKLSEGMGPAEALNMANDFLCGVNPEGLFATVFAGIWDPATGVLHYANAGHTRPVLFGREASFLTPDPGIALGLFEDAGIREGSITIGPDEGILLYTDGLTEARSVSEGFYGEDRLCACAARLREGTVSADVLAAILENADAFCSGADQFDDMALVCLHRVKPGPPEWIDLPVSLGSFEAIKTAMFRLLDDTPRARQILLACDEILTNIVSYSGADTLRFRCAEELSGRVAVDFADNGVPFDPTAGSAGFDLDDFEDLSEGGMGLGLVQQLVSSMNYVREEDENRLTCIFDVSV